MPVSETVPQVNTEQLFDEICRAQEVIESPESPVLPTRVVRDEVLSERYEADVWLVSEIHQPIGAYKIRGAYYAIASLSDDEKYRGVITASAGNHAQGVALSAVAEGIAADIYVPKNTPDKKLEKLGALCSQDVQLVLAGNTFDEAYALAQLEQQKSGATFIEPFNDTRVIAGQGTLGLEVLKQLPDLDVVLMPVGGGGLASGISTVAKQQSKNVLTIGVEPLRAASMQAAFLRKEPTVLDKDFDTFVDGAAVKCVGNVTYAVASQVVDKLVAVVDDELRKSVTELWERSNPVKAELAGALSVSGLQMVADEIKGKQVACIVSGGNLSRDRYERDIKLNNSTV